MITAETEIGSQVVINAGLWLNMSEKCKYLIDNACDYQNKIWNIMFQYIYLIFH